MSKNLSCCEGHAFAHDSHQHVHGKQCGCDICEPKVSASTNAICQKDGVCSDSLSSSSEISGGEDCESDSDSERIYFVGPNNACACNNDDDCDCRCECGDDCNDDDCTMSFEDSDMDVEITPDFTFKILNLDCPNCARQAQEAVSSLECVEEAHLAYPAATLDVQKQSGSDLNHCKQHVIEMIRKTGHDVELTEEEKAALDAKQTWFQEHKQKLLLGTSGVFLAFGAITEIAGVSTNAKIVFYTLAALFGLIFVVPLAIESLKRKTTDMNVLMSIAVIGALIMGFLGDEEVFRDAAIVIFLDQIGEWLEGWSMRKTSNSISKLMELAPDVAHVLVDGEISTIPSEEVKLNQIIRVLPGERIALDGVVVSGSTFVNEAPVTGESVSVDKTLGSSVYAGTLNQDSVIDVQVSSTAATSTLARIVGQVQGAQAKAAPYQSFVDKFAAVYTPAVVVGALIVGLFVPTVLYVFFGFSLSVWHEWIYRALSLLVVACPCALVISTPVSFVSAITCAARSGVLVKGGASLDMASKLTRVVFDKTGTLTTGKLSVTDVVSYMEHSQGEVLSYAASLEENSMHPIAKSIVAFAQERGLSWLFADGVVETAGIGVSGTIEASTAFIGKSLQVAQGIENTQVHHDINKLASEGKTVMVVAVDEKVIGLIAVADSIRTETSSAIAKLKNKHKIACMMLTGDNQLVAEAIAKEAGIDELQSCCMPEDKLSTIESLVDAGEVVCMVGDGINDAPALAKAQLAVTMGADASDTALEIANVALLNAKLTSLSGLVGLAKRTMLVVKENIALAIGIKLAVFVLVIMGYAGMGAAVFADTGVALLVIVNGMRLMLDRHISDYKQV